MRRIEARRRKASALWLQIFPVLGEPAAATEPTDGALDDPAFGQDDEALGLIAATDDFESTRFGMMLARPSWNIGPA